MPRRAITPSLTDLALTRDDAIAHLRAWLEDSRDAISTLAGLRIEALEASSKLENPTAIVAYVDEFTELFERVAGELALLSNEIPKGLTERHVDALRQIASNAAADQRRCLMFRDRWINRPLPYEQVRPLLNRIVTVTRDQLTDYREMSVAAERLTQLSPPEPEKSSGLDRRALFSRFLKRPEDER
jgi:hypothetical protein